MELMELIENCYGIDNALEVKDYPYGFKLRTSIFYYIEKDNKKGYRACTYTINPKTGKKNAPKKGVYHTFIRMYKQKETGFIKFYSYDFYDSQTLYNAIELKIFDNTFDLELHKDIFTKLKIRSLVNYVGCDLEKIKDFTFEDLVEFEKLSESEKLKYIKE